MPDGSDVTVPTLLGIDFETAYSDEYSLTRMPTMDYIVDPRFQTIGCSLKFDAQAAQFYPGESVRVAFEGIDWSRTAIICHNARFDAAILAWRYKIDPFFIFDTMSMARATIYPVAGSSSLETMAHFLGLGAKGRQVHEYKGKWLQDFTPEELEDYGSYCNNDNELAVAGFHKMKTAFRASELNLIDMTIRMYLQPKFQLDATRLAAHLGKVRADKYRLLAQAGVSDVRELMSNDRFAVLLQSLGVDPPTKISLTTGKQSWAFAKTDQGMLDLLDGDDTQVSTLVSARLGHKSTQEETRSARLLAMAAPAIWHQTHVPPAPWLPVPLAYYAAHTGRWGGTERLNLQNLKRRGELRRCIVAPHGMECVSIDASQIEARLTAWAAQCHDMLRAFASGEDVYSTFASKFYGRPITRADAIERMFGKVAILGLGFGMGAVKFRRTAKIQSDGNVLLDDLEAQRGVSTYRQTYREIPKLWYACNDAISLCAGDANHQLNGWLPLYLQRGGVRLPNGMFVCYPDLQAGNDGWTYQYGRKRKKLFGAKFVENFIQALARIIVSDVAITVRATTKQLPALMVHDELIYVVPKGGFAHALGRYVASLIAKPPSWAPGLPLAAEFHVGPSYGDVK